MCSEMSLCPCATGRCSNKQPNTNCIESLATVISTRAEEIRNASWIIECIKNNEHGNNKPIEYPLCPKVDGYSIPRCLNLIEGQYCGGTICK